MAQQEVDTVDTEVKDKLPREQPMASGHKRRCTLSLFSLSLSNLLCAREMSEGSGECQRAFAQSACDDVCCLWPPETI